MRIVCPSCQAAYEVPDTLLSGGPRRVRCARCGGDWVPEPVAAAPKEQPPAPGPDQAGESTAELAPPAPSPATPPGPGTPEPRPEVEALPPPPVLRIAPSPEPPVRDLPQAAPGRGLTLVAGLGWLASLALLAAAGWAGVAYREEVMAAWGASRRLYALLGLA